ncbi:MAG: hypothetical protein H6600_06045 [Flavobacteriales bacterium]|nr:hypothetical protein [Flavobacteriales bacterium]MCB9198004.1 hypothetical protein [Flavobacteriales bacterium]
MKTLSTFILMTIALVSFGQEQEKKNAENTSEYNPKTLLGSKDKSVRAYLGFNEKGVILNNQVGLLSGGELDIVFGHRLNIGFFGFGKTNRVQSDYVDVDGFRHYYELGMGGVKIERVFFTNSMLHFTVPVSFGVGAMTLNKYALTDYEFYSNNYNWENSLFDFDTFVFIEPGLNAELNLLKHVRLSAGVGYLFTDELHLAGTNNFALNNFTGNISLKLGWF